MTSKGSASSELDSLLNPERVPPPPSDPPREVCDIPSVSEDIRRDDASVVVVVVSTEVSDSVAEPSEAEVPPGEVTQESPDLTGDGDVDSPEEEASEAVLLIPESCTVVVSADFTLAPLVSSLALRFPEESVTLGLELVSLSFSS